VYVFLPSGAVPWSSLKKVSQDSSYIEYDVDEKPSILLAVYPLKQLQVFAGHFFFHFLDVDTQK
jgi:hypothetical protein